MRIFHSTSFQERTTAHVNILTNTISVFDLPMNSKIVILSFNMTFSTIKNASSFEELLLSSKWLFHWLVDMIYQGIEVAIDIVLFRL